MIDDRAVADAVLLVVHYEEDYSAKCSSRSGREEGIEPVIKNVSNFLVEPAKARHCERMLTTQPATV
jgi:hypothetical protein